MSLLSMFPGILSGTTEEDGTHLPQRDLVDYTPSDWPDIQISGLLEICFMIVESKWVLVKLVLETPKYTYRS